MTPSQTALNIRNFAELLYVDIDIYFRESIGYATQERKAIISLSLAKLKDDIAVLEEALAAN